MIVYDIEIKKGITPSKKAEVLPGIEYCSGWDDHKNMGISVVCAYDYRINKMLAFSDDIPLGVVDGTISDFQDILFANDIVVGFNNINFDDVVCRANGVSILESSSYDILRAIWFASGLSPKFNRLTHSGFGLDAVAKANGEVVGKTGDGAMAPIWFQRGEFEKLVDYCKQDVALTKTILDKIMDGGIVHPRTGKLLNVRSPYESVS